MQMHDKVSTFNTKLFPNLNLIQLLTNDW